LMTICRSACTNLRTPLASRYSFASLAPAPESFMAEKSSDCATAAAAPSMELTETSADMLSPRFTL